MSRRPVWALSRLRVEILRLLFAACWWMRIVVYVSLAHELDRARKYLVHIRGRRRIEKFLYLFTGKEEARFEQVDVAPLGILVPKLAKTP